jgi:hypothetical protein
MPSTLEWLIAGAAAGGILWYARKSQAETRDEERTAATVAAMAEARARLADAMAKGDRAAVDGDLAAAAHRVPGLTRAFDPIFAKHGGSIPVPYLRALAQAESGMRADDPLGIINVVDVALADFNRRHPERLITRPQMRNPETSVLAAADILAEIASSYERNHGDIPNLRVDWSNPRFVELLTFGWNAGFSERAGVGRVVRYLKAQPASNRPREITIDTVFAAARAAGAAEHLFNPRKLAYSKGVAHAYAREVERDQREGVAMPRKA